MAKRKFDPLIKKGFGFSGNYNDLKNKPNAFSGNYNDLSNKPDLSIFSQSANLGNILFVSVNAPIANNTQTRADALGRIDKPFQSLQSAVNVATNGDEICVFGTINETLDINNAQRYVIVGFGNAVLNCIFNINSVGNTNIKITNFNYVNLSCNLLNVTNFSLNFINCNRVGNHNSSTSFINSLVNTNILSTLNVGFYNINLLSRANSLTLGITSFVQLKDSTTTGFIIFENVNKAIVSQPISNTFDIFRNCDNINLCIKNVNFRTTNSTQNPTFYTFANIIICYMIDVIFEGSFTFQCNINKNGNTILRNIYVSSVFNLGSPFVITNNTTNNGGILVENCRLVTDSVNFFRFLGSELTNVVLLNNVIKQGSVLYTSGLNVGSAITENNTQQVPTYLQGGTQGYLLTNVTNL